MAPCASGIDSLAEVLDQELGLLAYETDVGSDVLIGLELSHHELKKALHERLKFPDAKHVQILPVGTLFN
jgi:hypothetical protein